MKDENSDNCWICKYSYELVQENGTFDVINKAIVLNQEEEPTALQVKTHFVKEDLPQGFSWDRNFKVLSIEPMKISRFKLALAVNPIHDEKVRYAVIRIEKSGQMCVVRTYEDEKAAIRKALLYNSEPAALAGEFHVFVRRLVYTVHQEGD